MIRLLCNGSKSGIFRLTAKPNLIWRNNLSTSKTFNPELQVFMHGRGNKERRDSVTDTILLERQNHLKRIRRLPVDHAVAKSLDAQGLGDKKRRHQVYAPVKSLMYGDGSIGNEGFRKTNSGAGGFAVHLTSASKDWPIFKHLLPEIAFAGHSNSGKSTLVNAMVGVLPSKGPAKVSARAGWTDQICFFQLGKKPPVLTLADLPGYGHAVASAAQRRAWGNMMRDYLQNRAVLSRCCILVDCTRGLCRQDKMLVRFLSKRNIPWMVVLTKGDLLDATSLAQCVLAVQLDLAPYAGSLKDRERFQKHMVDQTAAAITEEVGGGEVEEWTTAEEEEDVDSDEETQSNDSNSDEDERYANSKIEYEDEEEWETEKTDVLNRHLVPVHVISSSTGAGIQPLWKRLCGFARADSPSSPSVCSAKAVGSGPNISSPVREHRLAAVVRGKRVAQDMRARIAPGAPLPRGGRHTREGIRTKPLPIRIATNRRSVRARMEVEDTQDTS